MRLDLLGGGWLLHQDLSQMHELAFWNPSYGGIPCSALMAGRGLVLPQINISDLVDSPRKALPPLSGWGMGRGEVEGRRRGRGGSGIDM